MVRVFVAMKRKISVGDKMAGRHGNKVSYPTSFTLKIFRTWRMRNPVDIVLNPLGVPSRMNVGQILETHLGWAGKVLGNQLQAMIDEKFSPDAIKKQFKKVYGKICMT